MSLTKRRKRQKLRSSSGSNSGKSTSSTSRKPGSGSSDQASRRTKRADRASGSSAKAKTPKIDLFRGRKVFPAEIEPGVIKYVPAKKDASKDEIRQGHFIKENPGDPDGLNTSTGLPDGTETGKPLSKKHHGEQDNGAKFDLIRNRKVYPVETSEGTQYLPQRKDASFTELRTGNFVDDTVRIEGSEDAPSEKGYPIHPDHEKKSDQGARYDVLRKRKVYPVELPSGETYFVPKKEDASAAEIREGRYLDDTVPAPDRRQDRANRVQKGYAISADYQKRRKDRSDRLWGRLANRLTAVDQDGAKLELFKNRKVFPAEISPGVIQYLPRKKDATPSELNRGLFIDEALSTVEDDSGRRDVVNHPFESDENGILLWDGRELPEPSDEISKKLLAAIKPKYHLTQRRMLYPVTDGSGETVYLPLKEQATRKEKATGNYLVLTPQKDLDELLKDSEPEEFQVTDGVVKGYSQDTINRLIHDETRFQLMIKSEVDEILASSHLSTQSWT